MIYINYNLILLYFPDTNRKRSTSKSRKRPTSQLNYTAKDGTIWSVQTTDDQNIGRMQQQNVFTETPGPTSYAKRNITEGEVLTAFSLFIDKFMIDHIIKCTETEARMKLQNDSWKTNREEIYKLFGIMYARGLLAKGQPVEQIWSRAWGINYFPSTMSRDRYKELLKFIRFDIRSSRAERLQTDKFALISIIWNRFIDNSKACYRPNSDITVDEQLFPTKARCPFTQYIASKPDKFGIKFWLAVDATSKYLVNGFPYIGKEAHRPTNQPVTEFVVLQLMEPFLDKGRNVTTDNFFTSLQLSKKLQHRKTSIVGTMNRIRKEIPPEIKRSKESLYSSKILRHGNSTLTVYQGKRKKNVLLLSTVHQHVAIAGGTKQLPETVEYYNSTKYGVDILDQMARKYTSKVSSRRWPLQVFYNVLDLAAINAYVIYKETTKIKISRRQFMLKLLEELQMKNSSTENDDTSDNSDMETEPTTSASKRQWCTVNCGGRKKRRLAAKKCSRCERAVCGSCTAVVKTKVICKKCSSSNVSHA